jgi:hypothetical protein
MRERTIGTVLLALALAAPLAAQQGEPRDQWRLPAPPTLEVAARGAWMPPAIALGVPSGFGADWSDAWVGAGFQHRTRLEDRPDGGLVAGFGLGSARRTVGLEVALSQFGTFRSCCRGGLSLKLHRIIAPLQSSIAVGVENGVTWGHMQGSSDATDAGTSFYLAGTRLVRLRQDASYPFGSVTLTAGLGTGRFRTEHQILNGSKTVNPFGGFSLRVAQPASVLADWTGQDLVAGVSVTPLRRSPLVITPGVADLTTKPRFIVGVGYGFSLGPIF